MPFDDFFSSQYKRMRRPAGKPTAAVMRAVHRTHQAFGSTTTQFHGKAKLEMRGGGRDWWNFKDVPEEEAAVELELWRRANEGFEFRIANG